MAGCSVTSAVLRRKSVRRFRGQELPGGRAALLELLELASYAASGGNCQPWKCYIVDHEGGVRDELVAAVQGRLNSGSLEAPEYSIYPPSDVFPAEYKRRRRESGLALYRKLGIQRHEKEKRLEQWNANFNFFGAPVGIIVTIDRCFAQNGWGHVGCFLQTLALLAVERGLSTCLQEAWSLFPKTVSRVLGVGDNEQIWCGVALGFADDDAEVNTLRTKRAAPQEWVRFPSSRL